MSCEIKKPEELLVDLKAFGERTGHRPRRSDFTKKNGLSSISTYESVFGSFEQALLEAGFDLPKNYKVRKTCSQLIEELQALGKRLGRTPRSSDLKAANGVCGRDVYERVFGSLANALIAAGFEVSEESFGRKRDLVYTDEQLIADLRRVGEQLGRVPLCKDLDGLPDCASSMTYIGRFGSWPDALLAAGFESIAPARKSQCRERTRKHNKTVGKPEMIAALRRVADMLGFAPKRIDYEEFCRNEDPSSQTIYRRFGGWDKALAAAEITIETRHGRLDKLFNKALHEASKELGDDCFSSDEYDRVRYSDQPTAEAIRIYYGGWNAALAVLKEK